MSDSESDEEFLSADEGDFENGNKTQIEDEEVDELIDLLLKKNESKSKENLGSSLETVNESSSTHQKEEQKSTATDDDNNKESVDSSLEERNESSSTEHQTTDIVNKNNLDENPKKSEAVLSGNSSIKVSQEKANDSKPVDVSLTQELGTIETSESNLDEGVDENQHKLLSNQQETADKATEKLEETIAETKKGKEHIEEISTEEHKLESNDNSVQGTEIDYQKDEPLVQEKSEENQNENEIPEEVIHLEESVPKLNINTDNDENIQDPQSMPECQIESQATQAGDQTNNDTLNLSDTDNTGKDIVEIQTENKVQNIIPTGDVDSDNDNGENLDDLDLDDDDNHDDEIQNNEESANNNTCVEDAHQIQTTDVSVTSVEITDNESISNEKLADKENDNKIEEHAETVDREGEMNIADNGDWGDWGSEDVSDNTVQKQTEKVQHDNSDDSKPPKQEKGKEEVSKLKPPPPSTSSSSNDDWGWDSWADDFIIQAAGKVSNFLENVEGQLGIPDPTKMAEVVTKEAKDEFITTTKPQHESDLKSKPQQEQFSSESKPVQTTPQSAGVSSWFGGLSSIMQNTGTELVTGGIGALEFIGKKTVDILSEGDPGLRNKRDTLNAKKSKSLSATLREAKLNSEMVPASPHSHEIQRSNSKQQENLTFNDFFEKFQGNAHLDALEMLSSECENKLERILGLQSDMSKEDTIKILSATRMNYELSDIDDKEENVEFKKDLFAATKKLKMKVTCSKLLNTWLKIKEKSTADYSNSKECLENSLSCLAEMTSRCVEYYRKVADMLIVIDVHAKELVVERAKTLKNVNEMFQIELTSLTNNFVERLAKDDSNAKKIVTDIYVEGSNCTSMVKDCHDLLLPVLQCSVIK